MRIIHKIVTFFVTLMLFFSTFAVAETTTNGSSLADLNASVTQLVQTQNANEDLIGEIGNKVVTKTYLAIIDRVVRIDLSFGVKISLDLENVNWCVMYYDKPGSHKKLTPAVVKSLEYFKDNNLANLTVSDIKQVESDLNVLFNVCDLDKSMALQKIRQNEDSYRVIYERVRSALIRHHDSVVQNY